jgi:predicted nucleic acid-binding protein
MKNILIDTSVWIDFFNKDCEQAGIVENLMSGDFNIYLCPIVYQEILQGFKDDSVFNEVKSILLSFNMFKTDIMLVSDYAVDLYRALRKQGITIRKPIDCLIASYAILEDAFLLHNDKDFAQIALDGKLKVFEGGKPLF